MITTSILLLLDNNRYSDFYYEIGRNYESINQDSLAIMCYKSAIQINPQKAETYALLASIYYEKCDFENAIKTLNDAVNNIPENLKLLRLKGIVLMSFGKHTEALDDFGSVLAIDPNDILTLMSISRSYTELSKFDQAFIHCKKALELDSISYLPYSTLGFIYMKKEMNDSALFAFNKAVELEQNVGYVFEERGDLKFVMKDYAGAIEDYRNAFKYEDCRTIDLYYRMGIAEKEFGYSGRAIKNLTKVIQNKPDFTAAYLHRAEAYLYGRDTTRACYDWVKAAQMGSEKAIEMMRVYCNNIQGINYVK